MLWINIALQSFQQKKSSTKEIVNKKNHRQKKSSTNRIVNKWESSTKVIVKGERKVKA
ncbi:27832_t:CDS:2 [Dentiscutata erythropus]|uniref:27832_t:CDS:1 n=1 Tax=Dentiscutata erythropus TaxID=1348616 RepID=A0A9N9CBS7_9GLOM|nr:27832_t:CDS:2 [Dentiscutata erythropus]